MIGTMVRELSDGEELVMESVPVSAFMEDPRERAIEVRRLAERSGLERTLESPLSRSEPAEETR